MSGMSLGYNITGSNIVNIEEARKILTVAGATLLGEIALVVERMQFFRDLHDCRLRFRMT